MGTILQFRQPDAGERPAGNVHALVGKKGKASAEIIIFPGVRIERKPEPAAANPAPTPRKRARKTARRKV